MNAQLSTPIFAAYERVVMRVLFAWVVYLATPFGLNVNGIPAPNGFARLVDLHFLLRPGVFPICKTILIVALILYALRLLVWLALPVALFIQVAANAIINSQGGIQHAMQIVSLVLLAQTAAHFYGLWRRRFRGEARPLLESRAVWWSQQTIVAVYLVAGLTKLIVTRGRWIYDARWIGISIAKAAYQSFYDTHNLHELHRQLTIANFAAAQGALVAFIAACGLFLELGSPLMLRGRTWAALLGSGLVCFHLGLTYSMDLSFIYNQWLLIIFMINPPFWMVAAVRTFPRTRGVTSP